MKTFLVDYRYKGSTWSFDLKAENWADAEARLARIQAELHVGVKSPAEATP